MGARRVACKLDRIAINSCWHSFFPDSTALFDSPGFSDHSPGILKLTSMSFGRIFPFKFKNFWTEETDFADVVLNCWSDSVAGDPQFRFASKLKRLKGTLKSWQKGRFRDFEVMIAECSSALDQAHTQLQSDFSSVTLQTNVQNAKALLDLRLTQYESFVQQRSKIQWIKYGEETSALFHKSIKSRAARNSIVSLTSEQGLQLTEQDDIASEVIGYFTGLLGSTPSSVVSQFQIQGPIVDYSSHPSLCAIPSEDEIQTAFLGISKIKSPGPDGFGSWFFKNQWALVKSDACSALQDFFRRGRLLKQINATFICLFAKVDDPFKISQFRPISLCNTTLKAISKVIVNRIRPLLDEIVAYTQGAFIPGRSIASNLCVAQDLVKGYGSRSISPRCMLQIDLQKAYDYVSWEFLERCLRYFNFPAQLVGWIMATVTTTSFSVILNGESKGFFQGRRGLRQGDPLSPYLFVLVMEVLHRRLWEVSHSPGFSFHPRCKTLGISSIAFADDLLIFCKPNATTLRKIKSCLEEFAVESGLSANPAKSKVFFAGVFGSQKDTLADILGFTLGAWPVRYLGIPLNCKRLRILDFKPLLDRLNSAMSSRNARLLSYAGRMIVIKSVLESINSFWMQTLLLPKGVISLIKKLCRSFLWAGSVVSKRSPVAWKVVTRRWNEGGLNFKELLSWNKTLLMKLLFDLHIGKSSLWTLWARRNLMTCDSIWACYPRAGCSTLWRKLLATRDELSSLPGIDLHALALSDNPSKMDNHYVYDAFHSRSPELSWCSVIWNKTVPRKWAFICWLAMLDRLPTAVKLQAWGCFESSTCCLCQQGPEDSSHLWFLCTVTSSVLDRILGWQGVSLRLTSLEDWWHWFSSCSRRSSNIYKSKLLAFSAVIYHCWLFRNEVIFRNAPIDIEALVSKIIVDCKFRCLHKLNITSRRGLALARRLAV